jgi:hypothetical protein
MLELRSGVRIKTRTIDASLGGCYLEMTDALPIGTEARVYLTHRNQIFTATGNVVRSKRNTGIAIKFRVVECSQLPILQEWLFALERLE